MSQLKGDSQHPSCTRTRSPIAAGRELTLVLPNISLTELLGCVIAEIEKLLEDEQDAIATPKTSLVVLNTKVHNSKVKIRFHQQLLGGRISYRWVAEIPFDQ